jgi:hypothetical protein
MIRNIFMAGIQIRMGQLMYFIKTQINNPRRGLGSQIK